MVANNQAKKFPFKFFLRIGIVISLLFFVLTVALFGYVQIVSYKADQVNFGISDIQVVENASLIIITPNNYAKSNTPIYFIPGGLVQPQSYIKAIASIATIRKTQAFIQKPLLNLAITQINRSIDLIKEYGINKPIIGGHSLGGVVACRNIGSNPELFSGLFLFGSYCDQSIKSYTGKVQVIYGSNDIILSRESFNKNKSNLPLLAVVEEVAGLNHSGLFDYGVQKGDGGLKTDKAIVIQKLADNL